MSQGPLTQAEFEELVVDKFDFGIVAINVDKSPTGTIMRIGFSAIPFSNHSLLGYTNVVLFEGDPQKFLAHIITIFDQFVAKYKQVVILTNFGTHPINLLTTYMRLHRYRIYACSERHNYYVYAKRRRHTLDIAEHGLEFRYEIPVDGAPHEGLMMIETYLEIQMEIQKEIQIESRTLLESHVEIQDGEVHLVKSYIEDADPTTLWIFRYWIGIVLKNYTMKCSLRTEWTWIVKRFT